MTNMAHEGHHGGLMMGREVLILFLLFREGALCNIEFFVWCTWAIRRKYLWITHQMISGSEIYNLKLLIFKLRATIEWIPFLGGKSKRDYCRFGKKIFVPLFLLFCRERTCLIRRCWKFGIFWGGLECIVW